MKPNFPIMKIIALRDSEQWGFNSMVYSCINLVFGPGMCIQVKGIMHMAHTLLCNVMGILSTSPKLLHLHWAT